MSTDVLESGEQAGAEHEFHPAIDVAELTRPEPVPEDLMPGYGMPETPAQAPDGDRMFDEESPEWQAEHQAKADAERAKAAEIAANLPEDPQARWEAELDQRAALSEAHRLDQVGKWGNGSADYLEAGERSSDHLASQREAYLALRGRRASNAELSAAREAYEAALFADLKLEYDYQVAGESQPGEAARAKVIGRERFEADNQAARVRQLVGSLVREQAQVEEQAAELTDASARHKVGHAIRHSRLLRFGVTAAVVAASASTALHGILPENIQELSEHGIGLILAASGVAAGEEATARIYEHRQRHAEETEVETQNQAITSDPAEVRRYVETLGAVGSTGETRSTAGQRLDYLERPGVAERVVTGAEENLRRTAQTPEVADRIIDFVRDHHERLLGPNGLIEQINATSEMPADLMRLLIGDETRQAELENRQNRHASRIKLAVGGIVGLATFGAFKALKFERIEAPHPNPGKN